MPSHDYTAGAALELLIHRVTEVNPELGARMEVAVNEGKEIQELAPEQSGRGRPQRTPRYYRKNTPFTDEEALQVALAVLKSHLIETRMFARAAHGEFFAVGMTTPKPLQPTIDDAGATAASQLKDSPKMIEIELEPETVQSKQQVPNHRLEAEHDVDIDSLLATFAELQRVLDFGEP